MSSHIGQPVFIVSPEMHRWIADTTAKIGIDYPYLIDAVSFNTEELLTALLPGLALILNWSTEEIAQFGEIAGATLVYAGVAANPVAFAFVVVAVALKWSEGRGGTLDAAKGMMRGGSLTGVALGTAAMISGPAIIGVISGTLLALVIKTKMSSGPALVEKLPHPT